MKPRRWFRFSLRTLLLVVMTGCCILAWVSVQLKWNGDRQAALTHLTSTRRTVSWGSHPRPGLQRVIFLGERHVTYIAWVREDATDDQTAAELKRLFPEAEVLPLDQVAYYERNPHYYKDNNGGGIGKRVKTMHPLTFR